MTGSKTFETWATEKLTGLPQSQRLVLPEEPEIPTTDKSACACSRDAFGRQLAKKSFSFEWKRAVYNRLTLSALRACLRSTFRVSERKSGKLRENEIYESILF